jgi:hypothetical protein
MATESTQIHWSLLVFFGLLLGAICFIWHDTKANDAKAALAVTQTTQTQKTVDDTAAKQVAVATQELAQQNGQLTAALQAAKTETQQVELINQQLGTKLQVSAGAVAPETQNNPQAINPSVGGLHVTQPDPGVVISAPDVSKLAAQSVDFKESQNQVAVDQIKIAADATVIQACDNAEVADKKEIVILQGGSHTKRFFTAAKNIVIGAGVGIVAGILIEKK